MKITITSTTKIVELDGVPARVWEGHTEGGVALHCYITRLAVDKGAAAQEQLEEFEKDLQEHAPPSADVQAIPPRLVL
jgi:hypothetical protein